MAEDFVAIPQSMANRIHRSTTYVEKMNRTTPQQAYPFLRAWKPTSACRRCQGTLANALNFGDATCTLNNVQPTDGADNPFSTSTVSGILNTFHFAALSAAQARIEILMASGASDKWELVQVEMQKDIFMQSPTMVREIVGMFGTCTSNSISSSSSTIPMVDMNVITGFSVGSLGVITTTQQVIHVQQTGGSTSATYNLAIPVQVMTNLADSSAGAVATYETLYVLGVSGTSSAVVLQAANCS